jgi:glucose 1-dehydrogenase
MAVELAPHRIRVNAIQPGRTLTEAGMQFFSDPERRNRLENLIPMKRLAEPEEIANVAYFLASEEASYMTGAIVPVDGGYLVSKE